jgi:hypothetical protein
MKKSMISIMTGLDTKYLNENPFEWLLEDSDPSISYLARKEILQDGSCETRYDGILGSHEIQRLINKNDKIFGNTRNLDLFYKGTIWCFAEGVERGLDKRTSLIQKSAEFIINAGQTPAGGFTLNWHPRIEVACRTGDMIKYLIQAGYNDERVKTGIAWIASHQRHDGGWLHCPIAGTCDQLRLIYLNKPGSGLKRESNHSVTSCFYATIACSMALINYKCNTGSQSFNDQIMKASEFFLNRSLFKNSSNKPIHPKNNWNRDFRMLGYPIISQYDILYGLLFIAKAGRFSDRRTGEAFNMIISKQNNDGTWNMENAQTGMLYGNEAKKHVGRKSKWVTLQVLRLLKLASI